MGGHNLMFGYSRWIMSLRKQRLMMLSVSDDALQEWHGKALSGDSDAIDRLLLWAYWEANRYYRIKSRHVVGLTSHDAEDLASDFILDFQAAWRDVRSVARYTRYVLKKNLNRHLKSQSRRGRTVSVSVLENPLHAVTQEHAPWMRISDRGYQAYNVLCDEFFVLPKSSRIVVQGRLEHPPIPYSVLCEPLGMDVVGARMQVCRFFERVRRKCGESSRFTNDQDSKYGT
ncbi:MAG: hypothetical protein HKN13_10915 [Rhodothermales bacterium]|nr:hypothetical protein [Rhodothermales bacterium]